jgi:hypothetical protein
MTSLRPIQHGAPGYSGAPSSASDPTGDPHVWPRGGGDPWSSWAPVREGRHFPRGEDKRGRRMHNQYLAHSSLDRKEVSRNGTSHRRPCSRGVR